MIDYKNLINLTNVLPIDFVLRFAVTAEKCSSSGPAVAPVPFEFADETFCSFLLDEHGHFHDAAHVTHADTALRSSSEIYLLI